MSKRKSEIITFKADETLLEALHGVPNRSSFIRSAVLAALESTCPLCMGSGILTPNQQKHWKTFSTSHEVRECDECKETHLVCTHDDRVGRENPEQN